jgi:hypothetical protein
MRGDGYADAVVSENTSKQAPMTIHNVYVVLAGEVLGDRPTEEEGLALMILLHTHRIELHAQGLHDRAGVKEMDAITQRHAAEVLAAAWPDKSDQQRTDYRYWYLLFNSQTPYEVVEDIPSAWATGIEVVRERLRQQPAVLRLEPEM